MKKVIFIFSMMVFALSSSYAYTGYYWKLGDISVTSIYPRMSLSTTSYIGQVSANPADVAEFEQGTASITLGTTGTFRYFIEVNPKPWQEGDKCFRPMAYINVGGELFSAGQTTEGTSGMCGQGTFNAYSNTNIGIYILTVKGRSGGIVEISW